MQFGTTCHASLLRLALRTPRETGTVRGGGIGGHVFALGGIVPSGGIAGMGEHLEGGRVPAAGGAM
ncbi:MAG: hypothetical protein U1F58_18225 [Burkholderiales bacterium]